ncbi:hypothetical protein EON63_16265 [archaeon]|nr:MAG: hypothetical protein EON63_16265 [archaeon]
MCKLLCVWCMYCVHAVRIRFLLLFLIFSPPCQTAQVLFSIIRDPEHHLQVHLQARPHHILHHIL